jgi:SH3-like domain-containing protein
LKLFAVKRTRTSTVSAAIVSTLAVLTSIGCSSFKQKVHLEKYVFVTAKQVFLVDRVAAVSNRSGEVTNGEKLIVLDHARKFVKVQTPDGKIGWIKEDKVADQAMADKFEALGTAHRNDPSVGSGTARDEAYLHIGPGRETDKFYLLEEGDKLTMLERAMVAKPVAPGAPHAAAPSTADKTLPDAGPPAPVMEDWWLVRTAKGDTGWIYSHLMDVDAPDALQRYAEGQRIVGAYVLRHVDDPDSGILDAGVTVSSVPEYLTVLGPYKAGLPYDFDQVRVFTWNTKKHHYETAFREKNIAGYLPVVISMKTDPNGKSTLAQTPLPAFSYRVLPAGQPIPQPNPETGLLKPGATITKTYRLEGNICHRLLPANTPAPEEAHPDVEPEKGKKAKKK